ncbi:MAG: GNAT family N-acetyltransferase [Bacteroidota bacterium]
MNNDSPPALTFIEFRKEFAMDFATINYEWLEEYFNIEPQDRKILENPQEEVINQGGMVFFALINNKPVGTVALIPKEEASYELVKMGVLSDYKGLKIGNGLIEVAIQFARKAGKKKIVLETNSRLAPAIHLYKKAGFQQVEDDPNTKYKRCDLWMELVL